jgi:hypothetical protein
MPHIARKIRRQLGGRKFALWSIALNVKMLNLKMNKNILLIVAEVLVMGGWLFAVVAPLLFP